MHPDEEEARIQNEVDRRVALIAEDFRSQVMDFEVSITKTIVESQVKNGILTYIVFSLLAFIFSFSCTLTIIFAARSIFSTGAEAIQIKEPN